MFNCSKRPLTVIGDSSSTEYASSLNVSQDSNFTFVGSICTWDVLIPTWKARWYLVYHLITLNETEKKLNVDQSKIEYQTIVKSIYFGGVGNNILAFWKDADGPTGKLIVLIIESHPCIWPHIVVGEKCSTAAWLGRENMCLRTVTIEFIFL